MPFYTVLCVSVHYRSRFDVVVDLVRVTAQHIIQHGGVVRNIASAGTRALPQRIKFNGYIADYWSMDFDAGPHTIRSLKTLLRRDPRVIRSTTIKLGSNITDIVQRADKTVPLRSA